MEINKLYITLNNITDTITLDKILSFDDVYYTSNYISLNLNYCQNETISLKYYEFIPLDIYLNNPNEYPKLDYNTIIQMYKEFLKHDIVEARKYKLKLLNNGN